MAKTPFPFEFTDREDWPPAKRRRKRRIRRPTMRSVIAAAKKAGVEVGQVQVMPDGAIVIVPSSATLEAATRSLIPPDVDANEWN